MGIDQNPARIIQVQLKVIQVATDILFGVKLSLMQT